LRTADLQLRAARNASHAALVACKLAEGLAATGSVGEALFILEGAIEEARRQGGTRAMPELLRVKGVILASRSPTDTRDVDATLGSAIEVARRQGALAWELRATTDLARQKLRRGNAAGVLGELSAVYSRFTEGLETADLRAARSLLEQRMEPAGRAAQRRQAP
jgi:predicted ATPase